MKKDLLAASLELFYNKLSVLRKRNIDHFFKGVWKPAKETSPNWILIQELCQERLLQQPNNLIIASFLLEAKVNLESLNGLYDGLILIQKIHANDFTPIDELTLNNVYDFINNKIANSLLYNAEIANVIIMDSITNETFNRLKTQIDKVLLLIKNITFPIANLKDFIQKFENTLQKKANLA